MRRIYGSEEEMDQLYEEIDGESGEDSMREARPHRSPRVAVYPKAIVSKNGYVSAREFVAHGWRRRAGGGGVQSRRSRAPVHDGRVRFRVRMRAAARCNDSAAGRWDMMKQSEPARFDRGRALSVAIAKAARGSRLRP